MTAQRSLNPIRPLRALLVMPLSIGMLVIVAMIGTAPAAADACPNASLRAKQGSTHLSDCRAYELVSPPNKFGGQVGGSIPGGEPRIAPDGDHVAYGSFYTLDGALGGSHSGFLAARSGSNWTNSSILPVPGPNQYGGGVAANGDAKLRGSTPDVRTSVYFNKTTEPHGSLWVYRADGSRVRIADASVSSVVSNALPTLGGLPGQPWFEGISADGRTVVFASTDALVPGVTKSGKEILYVWRDDGSNGGKGSLDVVNRTSDPTLTLVDAGASATLGGSFQHRTNKDPLNEGGLRNSISADGSRIFFQTPPPSIGGTSFELPDGGGPLYVRQGTDTIEVSAPMPGHIPTSPPTKYQFLDASNSATDPSVDGRYVFFWADGDLTDGAPATGGIYRYDVDEAELTFLATAPTDVSTTAMASEDGSHLYYQDGGTVKLHANGISTTVFNGSVRTVPYRAAGSVNVITDTVCATADVTPNGHRFVFTAGNPLQVYLYDAPTNTLTHVSSTPTAPSVYDAGFFAAPSCQTLGGFGRVYTQLISDDGRHIFFDANAALLPGDGNGTIDVYAWHDGDVSLLSQGSGSLPSYFAGMGATGSDAFLITADPLVYIDPDSVYDIYDARIEGGLPEQNEAPPRLCQGDACQGPVSALPNATGTSSATFKDSGNLEERVRSAVSGIRKLSASDRSALAQGRKARLRLRVNRSGTVTVIGTTKIGQKKRRVVSSQAKAKKAGSVSIPLALSKSGRSELRRKRSLTVVLRVRFKDARPKAVTFTLKSSTSKKGGAR